MIYAAGDEPDAKIARRTSLRREALAFNSVTVTLRPDCCECTDSKMRCHRGGPIQR